ncbi:unnamed protein product [Malus baccata var. baccata]
MSPTKLNKAIYGAKLRVLIWFGDLDYDSLDRLREKLSTLCAVLNYVKQQQSTSVNFLSRALPFPHFLSPHQLFLRRVEETIAAECSHLLHLVVSEWPFLFISLCLEILSVACDQASSPSKPRYALFGMLLAIVGVLICVLEFIYKGIKGRVELRRWGKLWWFYYPPPPCYKPLGTVIEISGLIGGIAQCVTSTIQYVYFSQHLDSPFKVSLYPAILVICLIASRLSKDRRWIREGAGLTKSKMVD